MQFERNPAGLESPPRRIEGNGDASTAATDGNHTHVPKTRFESGNLIGSFALSYLLGGFLLVALFYFGGAWNVLANTRILSWLIDAGIIKYHDLNLGYVNGVDNLKHYLMSQDPIKWNFVYMASAVYLFAWVLLCIQFHVLARRFGLKGSLGAHSRAFIYGDGYNRFFPFWFGNVATSAALEGQGESRQGASLVLYMSDVLVVFGTIVFAIIGLFIFGWMSMVLQMMWPIAIFALAYIIVRAPKSAGVPKRNAWKQAAGVFKQFTNDPLFLVQVGALALLCVLADDFCPYFMSRAFTSNNVIMNVDFFTIQNGVVAGYIARLIPVTPGGIGQYEWAFASALYMSGVGFPEAATLALLDCAVRNITYFAAFWIANLLYGSEANFPKVLQMFVRPRAAIAA